MFAYIVQYLRGGIFLYFFFFLGGGGGVGAYCQKFALHVPTMSLLLPVMS